MILGCNLSGVGQISITGPNPALEKSTQVYNVTYTVPLPPIHNLVASAVNGSIINQSLEPSGSGGSRTPYVQVSWNCNVTSGSVTVTETTTGNSFTYNVTITPLVTLCTQISPVHQNLHFGDIPSILSISNCVPPLCLGSSYTYQWQVGDVPVGTFPQEPFFWTDLPAGQPNDSIDGGDGVTYQPRTSLVNSIKAYRRKTTGSLGSVYSDIAIVSFFGPLDAGYISGGDVFNNGVPTVNETPATGGLCDGYNYTYTWEISLDYINWSTHGSGQSYPAGIQVPTFCFLRRKVVCNGETAYSNILLVSGGELNPGTLAGGGTTAPNAVPAIIQTPAFGSICGPQDYIYTWESSVNNGAWQVIGTGINYPGGAITSNTKYRRKAKCFLLEAYTNEVSFIISSNTENKNYVRVNNILIPGVSSWAQADALVTGDKIQSTTYSDGLGRPIQSVSKEVCEISSNVWGDLVSLSKYDFSGRFAYSYLPYPELYDIGRFKDDVITKQEAYIRSTYNEPNWAPTFSLTNLDNSPLERPVSIAQPGTGWVGTSMQYEFNNANEDIKIWKIDFAETSVPSVIGAYATGKLFKSVSIDEKGKKVYEYKDFSGNTVLKKVQLDQSVSDLNYTGWLSTYYVYDDLGQLRSTITPKAVTYLTQNSWVFASREVYDELCFYNYFDERGRTVIKHSAGAGEIHMVYDKRDRLILSQDENQRHRPSTNQWSVYLYDAENRMVVSGLLENNASKDTYQNYATNTMNNTDIQLSIHLGTQTETVTAYNPVAGNSSLGLNYANLVINDVKYYDNYNYPGVKSFSSNFSFATTNNPNVEATQKTERVYGISTGSKVRVIDAGYDDNNLNNDKYLINTSYFDEKARELQGLTENIKGGTDYITMQYDFAGKTLSICEKQNFTGTGYTDFATITQIEYNKIGQKIAVSKKYGTLSYKKIASYTYDAMGRAKVKTLSPDFNSGAGIESLQYDYNILGMMTGINKDYALSNSSLAQWDHYFGMYMGYNNADNKFAAAQYNGNLTGIIWKTQGDNSPRKYDYVYDNADRLIAANFTQKEKPTDASWLNNVTDFSMTNVQYDENGNLLSMNQKGIIPGNTSPLFIDKLTYSYYNIPSVGTWSNKLITVLDNTDLTSATNGTLGDFKNETFNSAGTGFKYDYNGNMVEDNDKKIRKVSGKGIEYNFMDKPQKITIENKSITEFIYDASGEKIGKQVTDIATSKVTTTWYNNGFVYEETTAGIKLQYIIHEEGRVRLFTPVTQPRVILGNNYDLPDGLKAVFEFFVTDNLQNTRMVLSEETHLEHHNCTMETADANTEYYEETTFGKIDQSNPPQPLNGANEIINTRTPKATDTYAQNWTSNTSDQVSKLTPSQPVGPNMLLKVMAGDKLYINVDYYFEQYPNNSSNSILNNILGSITNLITNGTQSTGPVHGGVGGINTDLSNSSGPLNQFLQNQSNSQISNPNAFLNYLFFDENFRFVPYDNVTGLGSYGVPVTQPGNNRSINVNGLKVPKNGYVFVYLSNGSNINVYFDNLDIVHERGRLVEENAYYPYGLKAKGISGKAIGKLDNKYGYQGDFAEEDGETGWNEFDLRMYNPQIGRWNGVDPNDEFASPYVGMGANPSNLIDPSGGGIFDGVSAMVGMGVGLAAGIIWAATSDDHGGKAFLKVAGCAIVGGLIGAAIGDIDLSGIFGSFSNFTFKYGSLRISALSSTNIILAESLLFQLQEITGLILKVNSNGVIGIRMHKGIFGIPRYSISRYRQSSPYGRKLLANYILNKNSISVFEELTGVGGSNARANGIDVFLDPDDDIPAEGHGVDPLTFRIGMVFIHEMGHTINGNPRTKDDTYPPTKAGAKYGGLNEKAHKLNKIRNQLSRRTGIDFGRRSDYYFSPDDPSGYYDANGYHGWGVMPFNKQAAREIEKQTDSLGNITDPSGRYKFSSKAKYIRFFVR